MLQKGTMKDKSKRSPPQILRMKQLKKAVKRLIRLKTEQSHRKVVLDLQRSNIQSKRTQIQ